MGTFNIPLLTCHLISKQTPPGVRPAVVSPAAMARLMSHGWEGNGRELQNRVESALALANDGQLNAQDFFPEDSAGPAATTESLPCAPSWTI